MLLLGTCITTTEIKIVLDELKNGNQTPRDRQLKCYKEEDGKW
jgi:hypothetical protein